MDSVTLLVVALIVLLTAGMVFLLLIDQRWRRQRLGALRDLAQASGWQLQTHVPVPTRPSRFFDVVLSGSAVGADGGRLPWTIAFRPAESSQRSGSQSSSSASVEWQATAVDLPFDTVLLLPMLPRSAGGPPVNMEQMGGLGAQLGMFAVRLMLRSLGIEGEGLEFQQAGSDIFRKEYAVLSRSAGSAQRVLTPELENALLDWPAPGSSKYLPGVIIDDGGVRVRIQNDITVADQLNPSRLAYERQLPGRLLQLGLVVCRALQAAGTGGNTA